MVKSGVAEVYGEGAQAPWYPFGISARIGAEGGCRFRLSPVIGRSLAGLSSIRNSSRKSDWSSSRLDWGFGHA